MTLNNIRYLFVAVTSFLLLARVSSSSSLLRGGSDTTENSHQNHRRTIIGGSNAPSGRYSYFASLRRVSDGGATGGHFCGGSVIAPKVILTAAHCAGGKYAEQVRAVVGKHCHNTSMRMFRSISLIVYEELVPYLVSSSFQSQSS